MRNLAHDFVLYTPIKAIIWSHRLQKGGVKTVGLPSYLCTDSMDPKVS